MSKGGERIQLARPWTGGDEVEAVARVLEGGWLTQGPEVAAFERNIARAVGSQHAVAVNSGTAAIHMALAALGLPAGAEVVVPAFTFPATANAVMLCDLTPVVVDVDPWTYNMDPAALAEVLGGRTGAIMPVHQFGMMADMDAINGIAADQNLAVVEDAACAIGARSPAGNAGAVSRAGCFSFHPRKVITCGEGGAVVTDSQPIEAAIRRLINHGIVVGDGGASFTGPGYNLRLPDILATIGICQLKRLDESLERRGRLAALYDTRLAAMERISPPLVPAGYTHTYQTYAALLDADVDRAAVMRFLFDRGVESSIGAHPLHRLAYLEEACGDRTFDGANRAADSALCLPLHPEMIPDELDRVVETLEQALS